MTLKVEGIELRAESSNGQVFLISSEGVVVGRGWDLQYAIKDAEDTIKKYELKS